jgi:hypothetical protein
MLKLILTLVSNQLISLASREGDPCSNAEAMALRRACAKVSNQLISLASREWGT